MRILLVYMLILSTLTTCNKNDETSSTPNSNSHIEFFGFTLIDTFWDDPTDSQVKINYADEVSGFSNIADILPITPADNIIERVEFLNAFKMKAILHFNDLFFELVDAISPSGSNYDLREDYVQRWNEFKTVNSPILTSNHIAAFYIGEEPTWNGISFAELDLITSLIKSEFPNIPIIIIEAHPALDDLQIPKLVDWVGFNHYFIKNPNTNIEFQKDWQTLKYKLSDPKQRIMVIMDSHYIDNAHGDFGNIDIHEMGDVAYNYYELAKNDKLVIGILGYFWPNEFDIPGSIGARGMPDHVKAEYEQIGKMITKKQ